MTRNLRRMIVIAVAAATLATPGRSESTDTAGKQVVAGIVVVSAAVAVGVTFLILHEKHKTIAITGCVASNASGTIVTDEKDNRVYTLSSDPPGIKRGDRMTLEGKRGKSSGNTLIFEARSVTKDFGICPP